MGNYNGWTNYETWLVNLWLGDHFASCADDVADDVATDLHEMAQALEQWTSDVLAMDVSSIESGFTCDLINASLSRVDWRDIAEHYVREKETA